MVRVRARSLFRNRPFGSYAAALAVGILAGYGVARPVAHVVNDAFERFVAKVAAASNGRALKNVRVIALTSNTLEKLAGGEGLNGVSAGKPKSLRRLHGRLMERLAASGVKTVAWDIWFRGSTPFDGDFVQGVRRLQAKGAGVVAAEQYWWYEDVPAKTSTDIEAAVRLGGALMGTGERRLWSLPVLMRRGIRVRAWSLALAAVTSYCYGDKNLEVELFDDYVEIEYWTSGTSGADPLDLRRDQLPISYVETEEWKRTYSDSDSDFPAIGFQAGDKVGIHILNMPGDDVLNASTVEYSDVLGASDEQLREWFDGRVIVIGDYRDEREFFSYPDGRRIHGCYAHAVGIQQLLQELETPRRIQTFRYPIDPVAGAAVGVVLAILAGRRRAVRLTAEGVAAVLACAASVLLAKMFVLWNPLVFLFALVVACECAAVVRRQAVWPWRPSTRSTSS